MDAENTRVSKSLIAYATIATSAEESASIYSALQPFFIYVLTKRDKTIADPEVISAGLFEDFGIQMPPKAVEGMLPNMHENGILLMDQIGHKAAYELSEAALQTAQSYEDAHSLINDEGNVQSCLDRLEAHVTKRLSQNGYKYSDEKLQDGIKHAIIDPLLLYEVDFKDETSYLNLDAAIEYYTLEYVAIKQQEKNPDFDILSSVSAGGMAVNFLEAFSLPAPPSERYRVKVFVDTTIILSLCDFSDTKSSTYYTKLKRDLEGMGIRVCLFSENLEETTDILHAIMQTLSAGRLATKPAGRRLTIDANARVRAQAFLSNPLGYIRRVGFEYYDIKKDYPSIVKHFTYSAENEIIPEIRRGRDAKPRAVDSAAIANIGRLLRRAQRTANDIFSAPCIFVSENREVVSVGEKILKAGHYTREGFAPGLLTDAQFATAVWIVSGLGDMTIPRSRLLSNCAALVSANVQIFERVRDF